MVSALELTLGEIQTMNTILPFPERQSLSTLVSFEFLKGMCVLVLEKTEKVNNLLNIGKKWRSKCVMNREMIFFFFFCR